MRLSRLFRRRRKADDPAEELREKLAEAKSIVDERDVDEAAETPVDEAVPAPPQDRRAEVHERARQAMDELGSS